MCAAYDSRSDCIDEVRFSFCLRDFQPLEFQPVAAHLGKVVLCLLHKPAFFRASKDLGYSDSHFSRYAAFAVYEFR
jgi:hypothetical protein